MIGIVGMTALCLAGMRPAGAEPYYVVDTGPGAAAGGLTMSANQYLAGQFTIDSSVEINELEGWMIYPTLVGSLPVEVVLYEDFDDLPDTMNEIHRQLFTVPASGIPFAAAWHGVTGLSIPVDAGTYWLAFELPTGDFGSGAMPATTLQELDLYAIDAGGSGYVSNTTSRIGIRVLPEPGLATLLAAGIGFLVLARGVREGHGSRF
jgi:hypothetical protein